MNVQRRNLGGRWQSEIHTPPRDQHLRDKAQQSGMRRVWPCKLSARKAAIEKQPQLRDWSIPKKISKYLQIQTNKSQTSWKKDDSWKWQICRRILGTLACCRAHWAHFLDNKKILLMIEPHNQKGERSDDKKMRCSIVNDVGHSDFVQKVFFREKKAQLRLCFIVFVHSKQGAWGESLVQLRQTLWDRVLQENKGLGLVTILQPCCSGSIFLLPTAMTNTPAALNSIKMRMNNQRTKKRGTVGRCIATKIKKQTFETDSSTFRLKFRLSRDGAGPGGGPKDRGRMRREVYPARFPCRCEQKKGVGVRRVGSGLSESYQCFWSQRII